MTPFEKAQAIASGEITTGDIPPGGEVFVTPEPLLPQTSVPAPRTCLCKYTVAELLESLMGRTKCGTVETNDGAITDWGQREPEEGKAN